MYFNRVLSKVATCIAAVVLAVGLSALSPTGSEFVGKWKTDDVKGKPMEIVLSKDGTAKGTRQGEGLTGKWEAGKNNVVINWDSGWTTKIVKNGDKFAKLAYEAGKPAKGRPDHRSAAVKTGMPRSAMEPAAGAKAPESGGEVPKAQ
ncbi:MAG: hypothetical protein ACREDO_12510 [Methyloceanibacter sp.]